MGKRVVEIVVKATDNASGALGGVGKRLADLSKQYPALAIVGGLAIGNIVSRLGEMVAAIGRAYNANVELGASFQDMANRTDMSVESLARWKYVAEQNGATIDDFEMVFKKLRKTMADAASGEQQAVDTFRRLGIEVLGTDGKLRDLNTVLLEIGQVVRQSGMASIEAAAAQDALGRQSGKVVAVIKQESEALRAQMDEASAYTSNMTSAWAAAADAADDAAARFKVARENATSGSSKWWAKFRADWDNGWADFILYNANRSGWEKLRKSEEEAARAAAHAVAVSYIDAILFDVLNAPSSKVNYAEAILNEMASKLNVAVTEKKWSVERGQFVDEKRSADAIAADILKAKDEAMKKAADAAMAAEAAAAAPVITLPVSIDTTIDADIQQAIRDGKELAKLLQEVMSVDLSVIYGGPANDPVNEMTQDMKDAKEIVLEMKRGLEEIGTTAIDAFMNGEAGAIKFGDMIRRTITRAISEAIMKFIVLKALSAITGIPMAQGGAVPRMAQGGSIPRAALGYAVPDGPRGMDSVLIAGMPGEHVISRQLSDKLNRFLNAFESGAAVSPFAMSAGGGRGSVVMNMNIARPMSTLDAMDLGRQSERAARKVAEANL